MKQPLLVSATVVAVLVGWLPSLKGQTQQSGIPVPEPIKVPVAQPPLGGSQPPLPTIPGYQQVPTPPVGSQLPIIPSKANATGFPEPPSLFGGNNRTNSTGTGFPGLDGEKASPITEFLTQNFDAPDPNQDFSIKPTDGNWVICIHKYAGKEAAAMARKMVVELRGPSHKLNVFLFREGVEECKAEQKRILDNIKQQRERAAAANLPPDTLVRVGMVRYEIQYAVVLGGYSDMESARRDLERIKKLPPPDPNKVPLDRQYVAQATDEKGQPKEGTSAAINPFKNGIVVPNPSKARTANGPSSQDMEEWKRLNANESFSLLKCPKKYTLKVKQFSLQGVIQPKKSSSSMLEKFGFGGSKSKVDTAAVNAHNLADLLRKAGQKDVYVLHTEYISYVTVGGYDTKDDPRIARDQQFLPQLNQQLQLLPDIQLVVPQLMEVPR